MTYDAIVIGGGPAGSAAGMTLAGAGQRVLIAEKDVLPRHKLCGEFLSGEGVALVDSFGLGERLRDAGATPVTEVLITAPYGDGYEGPAPPGAMSLSRYRLDEIMLEQARESGADVATGQEVKRVRGSLSQGFVVRCGARELQSRTVVCAAGRSGRLLNEIRNGQDRAAASERVAFKKHFEGDMQAGRVELHTFGGGYCGLQRVESGMINACWVTRASALRAAGGKPDDMIDATFSGNRRLRERLEHLRPSENRFLAVSQLDFRPTTPTASEIIMTGDSAGMIAPLCGDGIAMAITSGHIAARHVEAFLTGDLAPEDMLRSYSSAWKRTFLRRMWIGRMLHAGMEREVVSWLGIRTVRTFPRVAQWLTAQTRA